MISIQDRPIVVESVIDTARSSDCGALSIFVGTVRSETEGRPVRSIYYEAYRDLAVNTLEAIEGEIERRWKDVRMAIVHRVGMLKVGEASLVLVAASPHRAEAFAACRYAIERIKEIVPIWKKEIFEDGEEWVGG